MRSSLLFAVEVTSRQFDKESQSIRLTKGRNIRKVPCNKLLRIELLKWINKNKIVENKPIFQKKSGVHIDHSNFIPRIFNKDIKESSLRPIRFHDLRHTAGTLMVGSGIDIVTVKEILGHKDLKTTMIYVHALSENIRKVASNYLIEPQKEGDLIRLCKRDY